MILWVLASEIAYHISLPYHEETTVLTSIEQQRLRTLSRRTWLFFEEYVGPEIIGCRPTIIRNSHAA